MIQLLKLYGKVVMISVSKNKKNKYDFFEIIFSGINNLGNTIVFCIALLNVKSKETYQLIFQIFFEKLNLNKILTPNVFVLPLEQGVIDSIQNINFRNSKI